MAASRVEHRFAVILCADVVGYSRLMGLDEEGTLAALRTVRRDLVDPKIAEFKGRIVRTMGDGLLVEFSSVVDAAQCAIDIQRAMPQHGAELPAEQRIRFRIALNMGDVVSDGDLIYGDGVAIASRMESLAEPGGINISRAVRDQIRDRLPVTFADCGEHEVANIIRPVRIFRVLLAERAASASAGSRRRTADRPALAVLPFQNLGGDGETDFFLDSVAEDLITELARARWFSIVARNTSFSYKGKGADAKQIARELGVRYLVEGSLRKAGNRVRISCQLVEAASGQHLWADRFDGTLEDSFDLQDRITESVIGSVAPVLREAEIERARRKPEASQDVYDLTLRAFHPAFAETPEANQEALQLLSEVLENDQGYPMAAGLAAWCHQQRYLMEWPPAQDQDRDAARRLTQVAITYGGDAPLALVLGGAVRAGLTRDHDVALAAVDRAMAINANSAVVLGFDALTRCLCGSYETAIEHADKAIRLSPLEPLAYYATFALALAYLLTEQTEEAVAHAQRAIEGNRSYGFPYVVLAAAYARLGRAEEAARTVQRLARAAPKIRLGSLCKIRFADADRLHSCLEPLCDTHLLD